MPFALTVACGYLIKKTPPAQLIEAIKEAQAGGSPMNSHIARKVVTYFQQHATPAARSEMAVTEREREILASLAISALLCFSSVSNFVLSSARI